MEQKFNILCKVWILVVVKWTKTVLMWPIPISLQPTPTQQTANIESILSTRVVFIPNTHEKNIWYPTIFSNLSIETRLHQFFFIKKWRWMSRLFDHYKSVNSRSLFPLWRDCRRTQWVVCDVPWQFLISIFVSSVYVDTARSSTATILVFNTDGTAGSWRIKVMQLQCYDIAK